MIISDIYRVYFIGIGGIGMSALARYFSSLGMEIAGYDRMSTNLTSQLSSEGMNIHFEDDVDMIPSRFLNKEGTLIIYTPAISSDHKEYNYFIKNNFQVAKRSALLGQIVNRGRSVAVAGTHGKTTISGMIAHILHESGTGCNAFLGGICKNFNSNFLLNKDSDLYVVEADEYDRSFLALEPDIALVSAVEPDHLDIYENIENLKAGYEAFIARVKPGGVVFCKSGTNLNCPDEIRKFHYSMNEKTDYYAFNIQRQEEYYSFNIHTPYGDFHNIRPGIFGKINVENSVVAFAAAMEAGVAPEKIINALSSYKGIKRRFDIIIHTDEFVFIDDYAHHPAELKAFINSVKDVFPEKKITGIFQPHLYSRTRDFVKEFATSLSLLDNVVLLDIYPAREKPIPEVDSGIIFNRLKNKGIKKLCSSSEVIKILDSFEIQVLLTIGAGDIDKLVDPLRKWIQDKMK